MLIPAPTIFLYVSNTHRHSALNIWVALVWSVNKTVFLLDNEKLLTFVDPSPSWKPFMSKAKASQRSPMYKQPKEQKLDGVGPVDNRPSTD